MGALALLWNLNVMEDYLLWMCCSKEGKMELSTLGFIESRPIQSGIDGVLVRKQETLVHTQEV